jgi:hypothetical protein
MPAEQNRLYHEMPADFLPEQGDKNAEIHQRRHERPLHKRF